jgi:hypothetical protein
VHALIARTCGLQLIFPSYDLAICAFVSSRQHTFIFIVIVHVEFGVDRAVDLRYRIRARTRLLRNVVVYGGEGRAITALV